MRKSETQRLEAKKREWDTQLREFEKNWRWVKQKMKKAMDWYWFNGAKTDGQKALHIIAWIIVTAGLVSWWNLAFNH